MGKYMTTKESQSKNANRISAMIASAANIEVGKVAVKEPTQPFGPRRITSPGKVVRNPIPQARILRV
jgi:hypothetical protein